MRSSLKVFVRFFNSFTHTHVYTSEAERVSFEKGVQVIEKTPFYSI